MEIPPRPLHDPMASSAIVASSMRLERLSKAVDEDESASGLAGIGTASEFPEWGSAVSWTEACSFRNKIKAINHLWSEP